VASSIRSSSEQDNGRSELNANVDPAPEAPPKIPDSSFEEVECDYEKQKLGSGALCYWIFLSQLQWHSQHGRFRCESAEDQRKVFLLGFCRLRLVVQSLVRGSLPLGTGKLPGVS